MQGTEITIGAPAAAVEAARAQQEIDAGAVAGESRKAVDLLPWLPCTLALDVPVINFSVATLLALRKGSLVETGCHQSTDIPLRVNGVLMAWTEFEVVGDRLAARITDMA